MTKYYFIDFAIESDLKEINPEEIKGFVKDGKATENWIFAQIDFSISYAFKHYGMPEPKYVFVNRDYKRTREMKLTIVREDMTNNLIDALYWNVNKPYVQDELNHQAWANSDEDGIKYKFEII